MAKNAVSLYFYRGFALIRCKPEESREIVWVSYGFSPKTDKKMGYSSKKWVFAVDFDRR
jgi:hypothetical protein